MALPSQAMPDRVDMPSSGAAYPGSGYDPTNPNPYKPDPNVLTPPPINAPPPKVSEEASNAPRSPGPLNPKSKVGGIAHIADSILRGVMRGKQDAEQAKAAKQDKLAKGLQFAYQGAASRYIDLIKNGADPNSKEVQEAGMAADAAWQSMMGMYGNYIFGDQKGKKSKSKSKSGGAGGGAEDPENPASLLLSKDPQDKIKGWWMISQKAGAPYKQHAAQYLTPEYQRDRQQYQTGQKDTARFTELEGKERTGTLSETEKTELAAFNKQRYQAQGKVEKKVDSKITPDNHHWAQWQLPDGTLEWRDEGETRGFASETKPIRAWQQDDKGKFYSVLLDPKTNQPQQGTENYEIVPPANLQDTIRKGEFSWIDNEGQLHRSATTTTTTHAPHGNSGGGGAPAAASAPGGAGASPAHAPHGDRIIGDTGKSQGSKSVRKASDALRPLANLLAVQTEYMDDIKKDPSKANPRSDLAMIIAGVRAMNPGSVRLPNKELELELQAGSYDQRLRRWYDIASKGTLPDDQRQQLFKIVHDETTKAGQNIVKDWRHVIKNEDLPAHLQQFDTGGGGAGESGNQPLHPEMKTKFDTAFGPEKSQ